VDARPTLHAPGVLFDYIGPFQVVRIDGRMTEQTFQAYLDVMGEELRHRSHDKKVCVFYHIAELAAMDSKRRQALAGVLAEHEAKIRRTTTAFAYAARSGFARGVLTALFWLAPPPYPYRITGSPQEGFGFLIEKAGLAMSAAEAVSRYERLLDEYQRTLGRTGT